MNTFIKQKKLIHFPMYLKFAKEDEGHPSKDELDNVYGWAKSIVEKA